MNKKTVLIPLAQNKTPCVVPRHAVWWSHLESLPTGLLHGQPEIDPVPRVVDHNHQHTSYRGEGFLLLLFCYLYKITIRFSFLLQRNQQQNPAPRAAYMHVVDRDWTKWRPKTKTTCPQRGGDSVICTLRPVARACSTARPKLSLSPV